MNKKKKFLLLCASQKSALPAAYTALEYLESSGTQYIDTGYIPNNETGLRIAATSWVNVDFVPFGCRNSATTDTRFIAFRVRLRSDRPGVPSWGYGWGEWVIFDAGEGSPTGEPWSGSLNWRNCRESSGATENFSASVPLEMLTFEPACSLYLFAANVAGNASLPYAGKITAAGISQGKKIVHDFIPALRNSDGEPGMFDTVSKQFFINSGTGVFGYRVKGAPATYSLRDPYRVAPSGVYARKASETELEIIADTEETSGDGWEWFANSADAMEHFGIIASEQIR